MLFFRKTAGHKRHFALTGAICLLLAGVLSCFATVSEKPSTTYDFSDPSSKTALPDTLKEISGLTMVSETEVGCVQDENGILFIYDLEEKTIALEVAFGKDGDYEGLAKVGNDMYILRSDGVLFELKNYASEKMKVDSIITGIPSTNNEGLCYDQKNHRLLVACKNASSKEQRNKRMIYAVDLKTKKMNAEPAYTMDVNEIKQFARHHDIELPTKVKKNSEVREAFVRFKPSAICLHPLNGKLYMLSAVDHMLFVLDQQGKLDQIEVLDAELFNKSEGICFLPNGDLLISNEGQEKKPNILRFNY